MTAIRVHLERQEWAMRMFLFNHKLSDRKWDMKESGSKQEPNFQQRWSRKSVYKKLSGAGRFNTVQCKQNRNMFFEYRSRR